MPDRGRNPLVGVLPSGGIDSLSTLSAVVSGGRGFMPEATPIVRFVTLDHIEAAVVRCSGVMAEDMRSTSRHKAVVRARRAFVLAARAHTLETFAQIAKRCACSGKHSSTITQHQRASETLATDTDLADLVQAVEKQLGFSPPQSSG